MPKHRNDHPVGYVDVPLIGREGGPVPYYHCPDGASCVEKNGPDHEHELVKPEGWDVPGVGRLIPGEVFEVSAEHSKLLLDQPDSFPLVKTSTEKKG